MNSSNPHMEIRKEWVEFLSGVYDVYRNGEVSSRELRKFADCNHLLTSLWLSDFDNYKEKLIRDKLNDRAFTDSDFTVVKFADDRFSIITNKNLDQADLELTRFWLPFLNNFYEKFGSNDFATTRVLDIVELAEKTAKITDDPKANKIIMFKDALAKIHGSTIGDYHISLGNELRGGSQTLSVKRVYLNRCAGSDPHRIFIKPAEPEGQLSPEDIWTNSWVEFLGKAFDYYGSKFVSLAGWVGFYRSLNNGRGRKDHVEFYMTNLISKDFGGFVVNTRINSAGVKEFSVMKTGKDASDTKLASDTPKSADEKWAEFFDRAIDCLGARHLSAEMLVDLAISENLLGDCIDLKGPSRFNNMEKAMAIYVVCPLEGFRVSLWSNIKTAADADGTVSISFDIIKKGADREHACREHADRKHTDQKSVEPVQASPESSVTEEFRNDDEWRKVLADVVTVYGSEFITATQILGLVVSEPLSLCIGDYSANASKVRTHLDNFVLNPIEGFTVICKRDVKTKQTKYLVQKTLSSDPRESIIGPRWLRFLEEVVNVYGSNFKSSKDLLKFALNDSLLTGLIDEKDTPDTFCKQLSNIILSQPNGSGFEIVSIHDSKSNMDVFSVTKTFAGVGKPYSISEFVTLLYAEFKESDLHFHAKVTLKKVIERSKEELSSYDSKILFDKLENLRYDPASYHSFGNGMIVTFMYSDDPASFHIIKKGERTNLVNKLNDNLRANAVSREIVVVESMLTNASLNGLNRVLCKRLLKETYFHLVASGLTIDTVSPGVNEISWK